MEDIKDEKLAKTIQRLKANDPDLTSIRLNSHRIGDDGAKAIAAALEKNHTLTSIDLDSNSIGADDAKVIAAALENNQSLTSINLGDNYIGDDGAKAIAAALENNQSLTSIGLERNSIGDNGAKAIAAALENNQSLTSIGLSLNHIGDAGAKAIAAALENNQSLTSIVLGDNRIGDDGKEAEQRIREILARNHKLRDQFLDAANKGQLDLVKSFLKQGVNIHTSQRGGMTALHLAAQNGHLAVVQYLVAQGASPQRKNNDGKTPLELAITANKKDVANYFKALVVNPQPPLSNEKPQTKEQQQKMAELQAQLDAQKKQTAQQQQEITALRQQAERFALFAHEKEAALFYMKQELSQKDQQLLQQHQALNTTRQELDSTKQELEKAKAPKPLQKIPPSQMNIGGVLGEGNFGEVRYGLWHTTPVAIKQLKSVPASKQAREAAEGFQKEMAILASLNSPYIVRFYGINPEGTQIIMEYCPNGMSLKKRFEQNVYISGEQLDQWAYEIAAGIAYLHQNNIIHCDLAARNVLLDEKDTAKLTDFGLSKVKRYDDLNRSVIESVEHTGGDVSIFWAAPEFLAGPKQNIFTFKTDVFSFGILLWEMANKGGSPLANVRHFPPDQILNAVIQKVVVEGYRDPLPRLGTTQAIGEAAEGCRRADPNQRPDANQLTEHFKSRLTMFRPDLPQGNKNYYQMEKKTSGISTPVASGNRQGVSVIQRSSRPGQNLNTTQGI